MGKMKALINLTVVRSILSHFTKLSLTCRCSSFQRDLWLQGTCSDNSLVTISSAWANRLYSRKPNLLLCLLLHFLLKTKPDTQCLPVCYGARNAALVCSWCMAIIDPHYSHDLLGGPGTPWPLGQVTPATFSLLPLNHPFTYTNIHLLNTEFGVLNKEPVGNIY